MVIRSTAFFGVPLFKEKEVMNLGLPQPTRLNSWVLPACWHATQEILYTSFVMGEMVLPDAAV